MHSTKVGCYVIKRKCHCRTCHRHPNCVHCHHRRPHRCHHLFRNHPPFCQECIEQGWFLHNKVVHRRLTHHLAGCTAASLGLSLGVPHPSRQWWNGHGLCLVGCWHMATGRGVGDWRWRCKGDLDAFPTLAYRNSGVESSPGPPESIGGVSIFSLDEPWKYGLGFGCHRGVQRQAEGGGWISFVYCRRRGEPWPAGKGFTMYLLFIDQRLAAM